jgi:hypothetical protein
VTEADNKIKLVDMSKAPPSVESPPTQMTQGVIFPLNLSFFGNLFSGLTERVKIII